MKLSTITQPEFLLIVAEGRLDATWAEHFLETTRRLVREGHHQLRLDAGGLDYLSSAGIRALLQTHQELAAVRGSFVIIRASDFVRETLRTSGFDALLALEGQDTAATEAAQKASDEKTTKAWTCTGAELEVFKLDSTAPMRLSQVGRSGVLSPIEPAGCREMELGTTQVALGLGAPGRREDCLEHLGDFIAVEGCTAYLPGDGAEAPDYLVGAGHYIPKLQVANALRASGTFSHLLRFQPGASGAPLTLDQLLDGALCTTGSSAVAAVILAEIDGLVGLSWARSPGLIAAESKASEFPAIRDWLGFCGERVHGGELALVVAFASTQKPPEAFALPSLPSHPGWHVHAHALVFPFRPLPNGKLDLPATVQGLFAGAEPLALLHLVEDDRPALGLGHSAFVRGACWCAPVQFSQEDLS
jgi:anti-anti-sigma factor